MKLTRILLSGLAFCLVVFQPSIAAAQGAPAKVKSGCHDHYAEWPADAVVPPGTFTAITVCKLAGHTVRINSASYPMAGYNCGISSDIQVSAWVDGVKVVDRRQAGSVNQCMSNGENTLTRILINDRMHLTICEDLANSDRDTPYTDAELKPGQTSAARLVDDGQDGYFAIETCTLSDIPSTAGHSDPYVTDHLIRTPPGLVLDPGSSGLCPVLTGMAEQDQAALAPALSPFLTARHNLDGTPYDEAADGPNITEYSFDVDHDGVADVLSLADLRDPSGMGYPPQYNWRSGKTGETHAVTVESLGLGLHWTSDLYDDPVRDDLSFITLKDGIYLYRAQIGLLSSFPTFDVSEVETEHGAIEGDFDFGSRQVYALQPDGTAKVICQWSARKRPEEFL